ncbi:MAG: peptide MFS transporter [Gemmatimonadota bacterium]
MPDADVTAAPDKQFFGHPTGLSTLFFTEMWERFSYYGMRGILILFMTAAVTEGGMELTTATAAAIYGLYTAAVYLLALPGGWVADRLLGQRNAVFTGGVIIAAGHFSMAVPGDPTFYMGLVLIALGTGLLKPNVSAIVADLYPEGGARRDAGFSIFYMGINVGALFGPFIVGFLGEKVSWHMGFSAAGIGMVLGLAWYKIGGHLLGDAGRLTESAQSKLPQAKKSFLLGVGGIGVVAALAWVLNNAGTIHITLQGFAQTTGVIIVSLAVVYFLSVILFGGLETAEKKRVGVIFLLFLGAAVFWSGFEQAGSSLNLFAAELTDRSVFGWEMPASFLQSINPFFVIVFAPVFGWLWIALGSRVPSLPIKFGLGLVLLGVGFLVMAWGATYTTNGTLVSPNWLVATYFLHTCGELCLSPVGLSSVTKLAPKRLVGQMMGTWFMGTALGNLIAGLVAGRFDVMPLPQLFVSVSALVGIMGVLFFLLSRPIKRLMGGAS